MYALAWQGHSIFFYCLGRCSVDMNPFTDNPRTESVLKGQLVQAQHPLPKWSFCQQLGPHFQVAVCIWTVPSDRKFSLVLELVSHIGFFS